MASLFKDKTLFAASALALMPLSSYALVEMEDEMLSDEVGQGIAVVLENAQIQSPTPNGALNNLGRGYDTTGSIPALNPYLGLNMEFVNSPDANGNHARFRLADIELGNLDDAAATSANLARFGNALWDDPLRISIEPDSFGNSSVSIKLPGNLDYGTAGNLLGQDKIPNRFSYGFVVPDGRQTQGAGEGNPYSTENKGQVYRFPHEPGRHPDLSVGAAGNGLLANYSVQELAPIHNFNMQADLGQQAYAQTGIPTGLGPDISSQSTNGLHRLATLRLTGIHSGRTNTPSVSNPTGLNAVILRPGGLAKALILPNFHCFSSNGSQGGNASMRVAGPACIGGGAGGTVNQFDQVANGSRSGLTQNQILVAEGATAQHQFDAYPQYHDEYRRDVNDDPIYTGGIRGVVEINHLRIDDVRMARSEDLTNNTLWGATPADGKFTGGPGNADVGNREFWITDFEIRDLRIGSFAIDSTVDQAGHPANIGGDLYENTNFGNEIAPLSLTFFNDPYNGRQLQLFLPYHNAAAVGNGSGRLTYYAPFAGPHNNGQCCGAVVIDGIQIDYLDVRLDLD